MVKHSEGFTVLELVLVLFIIATFTFTFSYTTFKKDKQNEPLKILEVQSEALLKREKRHYNKEISFNSNGNINQAQRQKLAGKLCVFQLGFGRFYCE